MSERQLSILEALENLNTLVEADSLDEIEVTDEDRLISHKISESDETQERGYWVRAGPDEQTLGAIRETFRTVHDYLVHFYSKMKGGADTKRLVEGINTVMVLVGEAAKKLDRFSALFKQRITETQEYQEIQEFYRNRVIKESFHAFAKAPIPKKPEILSEHQAAEDELRQLLAEEYVEEVSGVHLLNDLEVVKRDHLYELFYIKNEAGHPFYSYALARNIKLACDFGEFAEEYFGEDPLLQIKNWEDKQVHLLAGQLLKHCSRQIDKFYKEALKFKEVECVEHIHNALMALMLAANPRNLIRQFALKGSHLYFKDFLVFLRQALNNREYQKFLIYSPPSSQPFFRDLFDLILALCYFVYMTPADEQELNAALKQMLEKSPQKTNKSLSEDLKHTFSVLTSVLSQHPNGPVFKALDIVREEEERHFDPLLQGNIPATEWSIRDGQRDMEALRMACPILQDTIHKAYITEEFKAFLRAFHSDEHFLYINFQDRTSWKEHARAQAIEELSRQAEFANALTVVTLATDTDFYHQSGHYENLSEAEGFIRHFMEHLNDEATGYYFSHKIKKQLFPQFIQPLLQQVHQTFFNGKKQLSYLERLDFIQIIYHLIELKLLELVHPAFFSLSSKDGLDVAATASVGLIALLTLSKGQDFKRESREKLHTLLFGPTLLIRERVIHPERFERLVSMIQRLEQKKNYLLEFEKLFQKATLNWEVSM